MKNKKLLLLLMSLVLIVGLVACQTADAPGDDQVETTEAVDQTEAIGDGEEVVAGDGDYTIGLVVSTQTNPFFVSLKEGVEAKANELGVELVVVDAQDDAALATSGMEDLITRQVDLIIVNPTDSDAIANSVLDANEANIPVITVDRVSNGGEVVTHIASDNVAGGEMAGEYIIELVGENAKVVELEGVPGANSAIERGEGFNDAIAGTSIEVVAKQTANFDRTEGLNVMENILQAQPEIDAVFAHNDEMALGALEAIEGSGREIVVVGFDATDDAVVAVEEGRLAATIAQKPELMGQTAVESAVSFLNGESTEDFVPVELELIK